MTVFAKYTFFEQALQQGFAVSVLARHMEKSRDKCDIRLDPARGRVLRLFRAADPERAIFEYVIPDRAATQSTDMWKRMVEKDLEGQWTKSRQLKTVAQKLEQLSPERQAKIEARVETLSREQALSGPVSGASASSPSSSHGASSTDAPPKSESSSSPSAEAEPVATVSVPPPSTPGSSKTGRRSSKTSAPRSPRSA